MCVFESVCARVCVTFKLLYKASWQNQYVTTVKPLIYNNKTTQLSVSECVCLSVCVCA